MYLKEHKRLIKLLMAAKEKPLRKEGVRQAEEIKQYFSKMRKY